MSTETLDLPPDFLWGVATAAYQIEGAVAEDGRGESIWDRFTHTPGNTPNGQTGDIACDHYHRWPEDIGLMRELGVRAYRFSIAWPRIVPDGVGTVNPAGLDFYDRLVDALLEAGIKPFPTLYHWDLPQALEDAGGWPVRETAYAFAEYAAAVAERLGDRVHDWWTVNEPWCVAELGYRLGEHAPGRADPDDATAATHHVLLAHGLGMQAVRDMAPESRIGIVVNVDDHMAKSAHPADQRAAELAHTVNSRWYLDPVLLGKYPAQAVDHYGWDQRQIYEGDMDVISTPMDHIGINYYTRRISHDDSLDDAERPQPIVTPNLPRTTMGWEVYPQGLHQVLTRFNDEYDLPPTYVAENGVAFVDEPIDDVVHDEARRVYLEEHFRSAADAYREGVPLRGYFVWTLMDNFEWQHGFQQRFGLVRTDFETQRRTLKDSGRWFAQVTGAKP